MEPISHLLNHHSLSFLIQVAFPNLALVSMVQGSGTGTTTTGLSKALQQSLQAMNGMRLNWALVFTIQRCLVCLVLQHTGPAAHVPLQFAEPDPSTQSSLSIPVQASFLRLSHTHTHNFIIVYIERIHLCPHGLAQLHVPQEFHIEVPRPIDMVFIPLSSFIQPDGLRDIT